jgi:hypothetical protein
MVWWLSTEGNPWIRRAVIISLGLHMAVLGVLERLSKIWKFMNIYVNCTESGSLRIWLKVVYTCVFNYLYSKYSFYQSVVTKDSKSGRKQWNKLGSPKNICYWNWGLCVYKVHTIDAGFGELSSAHTYMAWCLIKHGDGFTFVLFLWFIHWQ